MQDSSKETSRAASTLWKVVMILQHIGEPDATIVQESLRKFGELVDTMWKLQITFLYAFNKFVVSIG